MWPIVSQSPVPLENAVTSLQQRNAQHENSEHTHFVGIGGSGMSAIARVVAGRGGIVSGSDMQDSDRVAQLRSEGMMVMIGHSAENIAGADKLVISSAIPENNPEVVAARRHGVPVLKRADFLGDLMHGTRGVGVAGSHGKTTTTGMIAHIALSVGLDPTVIVGGEVPTIGANGRPGQGDVFVVEADEYDYMFLGLQPEIAVITNIEHDHPDMFPTWDSYLDAFTRFARLVPAGGMIVACTDDPGVRELVARGDYDATFLQYGISAEAALRAVDIRPNPMGGADFLALEEDSLVGLMRLRVPGEHNVRNALAAIAVARALGVDNGAIQAALATFGGVGRRFQEIGTVGDVTIIDDYAHHPTEIRMTLKAARQRFPGRRIWAVWQPHTYTRTRMLLDAFAASFDDADRVIALDIYRSREQDTLGVDAGQVVAAMDHPYARHIGRIEDAAAYILDRIVPDDVVLTLGAGDGNRVGQYVLNGLEQRVNKL